MDAHTADRVFVLQKIFELEKTLSKLDLNPANENTNEVLNSINDIKLRFSAGDRDEKSIENHEKKIERRLSLIGDKEMAAIMKDILPKNKTKENNENNKMNDNNGDDGDDGDDEKDCKADDGSVDISGINNTINSINNINNNNNNEDNFDCIIAMAGGLKDDGTVYQWVANRLDLVYSTYNKLLKKPIIICTGGGTYHKPEIRGNDGWVIHESTSLAKYLINKGVNSNDIIREWGSYDTIASVYFTLVTCVLPRNFKNIAIITSTFHMPRTKLLFKWIFSLHNKYLNCNVKFLEATDDKSEKSVIDARTKREEKSCQTVKNLMKKYNNIETFHKWLFTEHKAYSCNFINQKRDPISETQKKSY